MHIADGSSAKREHSASSDEQRTTKRLQFPVDMTQIHPKDPFWVRPKNAAARMLPSTSSSLNIAPGPSTASSGSLATIAPRTAASDTHIAMTRPLSGGEAIVCLIFTPSRDHTTHDSNSRHIAVVKNLLRYHSPWMKRIIDAGGRGVKFARTHRHHVTMFLSWMFKHKLIEAEERYCDGLDMNGVVAMLQWAQKWENPRYENEVRKRAVRYIDNCKTISNVQAGGAQAEYFVRTMCVLKYAALVRDGDLVGLQKVFHIGGDAALASTKVLLDHLQTDSLLQARACQAGELWHQQGGLRGLVLPTLAASVVEGAMAEDASFSTMDQEGCHPMLRWNTVWLSK